MDHYDRNPYYHPEHQGVTTVATIDWREPCYDFDMTVVWRREDGTYAMASDSGCSRPSPFENTVFADLPVMTRQEVMAALTADFTERAGTYGLDESGKRSYMSALETLAVAA